MMNVDKDNVVASLKKQVCKVVFTKANGDERVMHATLNEELLPPQQDVEEYIQKKKPNPKLKSPRRKLSQKLSKNLKLKSSKNGV